MKRIYTYILLLCLLLGASCADDFQVSQNFGIDADGTIEFTLSIPEMETVATRAVDENKVNSLTLFVVSGNEVKQIETFNEYDTYIETSLSFSLKKELRNNPSDLQFYFLANYPAAGFKVDETTLADLKADHQKNAIVNDDAMVMSATYSLKQLVNDKLYLYRNAAKVTVSQAELDTEGEVEKEEDEYKVTEIQYPLAVLGSATESSLMSGATSALGEVSTPTYPSSIEDTEKVSYVHPTENTDLGTYVIVKAPYEGTDYYYRLDFKISKKDENDNVSETILDLKSNHHYQFVVKSIDGPGYDSPKEAAANPTPMISYDIHDHAPTIYNMISDGIRELGVSHEIVYDNAAEGQTYLSVKLYSKADNAEEDATLKITSDSECSEWLEIGVAKEVTSEGVGKDGCDDPGSLYQVPISFRTTSALGTLHGEITVTWMGLTRKVPVTWKREFKGTDLCDVILTIYDAGNQQQFNTDKYWDFLAGKPVNGVSLFGTGVDTNNGKVRNQGLHFPVMYGKKKGDDGNFTAWSYSYALTMKNIKVNKFDWSVTVNPKPGFSQEQAGFITIEEGKSGTYEANPNTKFTLNISRPGNAIPEQDGSSYKTDKNDYEYWVGELVLTIVPDGSTDKEVYKFDLYHTGFFHKSSYKAENEYREDTGDYNNYYYYEVVPIMGATRMRYWLDRNLGAKSAELYIEATGDVPYYGNKEAAGGYYRIADEGEIRISGNNLEYVGQPIMYDDGVDRVSPPGYRVPKQKVWNALRNSTDFHTISMGSYYTAYYKTSVKDVYFPKARYKNSGTSSGESRAGYYWTQTPSSGTEKEEVARWLNTLCISGNSSSYINGNVENYAMSVRCINDITDNDTPNVTSFNVSGATHVYLYTENKDGTRTAVTNWPGKYIGDYNTMKNGWFNFSYESDNIPAEDFYVIFNYLDEKGIIHTFSKGSNNTTSVSTTISVKDAEGWKVVGDDTESLKDSSKQDYQGVPTKTSYWWQCNKDAATVYCYKEIPPRVIYVHFKGGWEWNPIRIHYWGGSSQSTWMDDKYKMEFVMDKWYKYSVPDDTKFVKFYQDNSNGTGDLTLGSDCTYNFEGSSQYWSSDTP